MPWYLYERTPRPLYETPHPDPHGPLLTLWKEATIPFRVIFFAVVLPICIISAPVLILWGLVELLRLVLR